MKAGDDRQTSCIPFSSMKLLILSSPNNMLNQPKQSVPTSFKHLSTKTLVNLSNRVGKMGMNHTRSNNGWTYSSTAKEEEEEEGRKGGREGGGREEGREGEEDKKNPFPSFQFGSTVLIVRAGITDHEKQHENPEKGVFRYEKHMYNKCLSGR